MKFTCRSLFAFLVFAVAAFPPVSQAQEWGSGAGWSEGSPKEGPRATAENGADSEGDNVTESPDAAPAPAETGEAGDVKISFDRIRGFRLSCGGFEMGAHLLFQYDLIGFEPSDYSSNSFLVRRGWLTLDGSIEDWFDWQIEYDFANPGGGVNAGLRDSFVSIDIPATPIALKAGYFKPSVIWEESGVETEHLVFLERAAASTWMFPGRTAGFQAEARLGKRDGKSAMFKGRLGIFNGDPGTFGNFNNDWGLSAAAEVDPFAGSDSGLDLQAGASAWYAYRENYSSWEGLSTDAGVSFFDFYFTSGLEQLYSCFANLYLGRFAVMAEMTYGQQQRKRDGVGDLAPIWGFGYRVDAALVLWSPDGKPVRGREMTKGIEAVFRLERFALDEIRRGTAQRVPSSTAFFAANPRGGRMDAATVGLNWYADRYVRFGLNLQSQWFRQDSQVRLDTQYIDHVDRTGGPRFWVHLRLQIMI